MVVLRWAALFLAFECVVLLMLIPRSTASAVIAGIFFLLFLIICWSYGAFTSDRRISRKATQ